MGTNTDLIEALNLIVTEKGIDPDIIFEAIETSLVTACKKNFGNNQNVKVVINRENGEVNCFSQKEVVDEVFDPNLEISIEEAREIKPYYELGDFVDIVVTPKNFGRIAAQTAKQVVVQKFREAERDILFNEYITKEKELVTGIVQRKEHKNVIIALGKMDALLTVKEQIPGEEYNFQDRIKVYVVEVKQTSKGPIINVSRTHPELVKRLFEQEVPEIYDGSIEIKSISREAGSRTKIAVKSNKNGLEAVPSCVGQNGSRVNVIMNELNGEKIDIIEWNEDPKKFIFAALSPSKVTGVFDNEETKTATVIVPDKQLSLAIGKEGENARLAANLTGWKIDLKSETKAVETNFITKEDLKELKDNNKLKKNNKTNKNIKQNNINSSEEKDTRI